MRYSALTALAWLIASVSAVAQDGQAESAKQLWFGTMKVKEVRQFRFLVELAPADDGWSGELTSLDEGARKFKLSDIKRDKQGFSFALKQTAAAYEGQPSKDGKSIEGKWKQSGKEFEFAFRRVKQAPARKIKTAWKGTIDAVIQKLDVAVVELESGELLFDSISQKAGGFYIKDESKDGEVVYKVPAVNGTFKGKYSDDKSKIEGKWSQGLVGFTLVLSKVDPSQLAAAKPRKRPQMPKAPFPYDVAEIKFDSKADGVTLAGTLTKPKDAIKAAVVMISGSGPQDRDETLLGHKPFWVIADHFARHGIATLRFDDRGIADSTGDFGKATSLDFADDAEGAWRHLRSLPELKGVPVGFCGHSEGGLVAPIVAARNKDIGFIVLMAGTGVNGEQILYSQGKLILAAEGAPPEAVEKQGKVQRALLGTVVKNPQASEEELLAKVLEATKDLLTDEDRKAADIEAQLKAGVAKVAGPWFRHFLVHEPKDYLTQVSSCPVLALNGEKDVQVDPKLNLPAIEAALREAGNEQFETVELPGLNHLFQQCKTGGLSEYETIEETVNEAALRRMSDWILKIGS